MAMTAAERKRDQRERDKLTEDERLARLLARRISTDLFHNEDAALKRAMSRSKITEEQDMIARLILGTDRMTDSQLAEHIRQS